MTAEAKNRYVDITQGFDYNRVQLIAEQVLQFQMLQLPGQPQMMHMGTGYLVSDLMNLVNHLMMYAQALEAEITELKRK